MGTFNIGEVGEYTPQTVEENDFLNDKLESDTYGIYYSVKFYDDADTYLMQAKKPPVVDQPEWGKIEMSKSGKSKRFTRVKREDQPQGGVTKDKSNAYLKDVSDIPIRFMQSLLQYYDVQTLSKNPTQYNNYIDTVKLLTEEALSMIDNIRNGEFSTVETKATGYDKAKQTRATLNDEPPFTDEDDPGDFNG